MKGARSVEHQNFGRPFERESESLKGYLPAHLETRCLRLLGFPPDLVRTAPPCGR